MNEKSRALTISSLFSSSLGDFLTAKKLWLENDSKKKQ